jgi:hypothetical protein
MIWHERRIRIRAVARRRRPRAVGAARPKRIHHKTVAPLPQRQRALPQHALAVDHRGGTG